MKNTFLIFGLLAYCFVLNAYSDEIKAKQHQNIKGNELVYTAGDIYNKNEVYNTNEVYNKNEVYNTNEVYNKNEVYTKIEINEIINIIRLRSVVQTNRYPLFCIELNTDIQNYNVTKTGGVVSDISLDSDDTYSMSDWDAFELKASTNNFLNIASHAELKVTNETETVVYSIDQSLPGLNESQKLLYWACSEFSMTPYESSDTMRKYVTESRDGAYGSGHDPRTWYFFNSVTQLTNRHPAKVMVLLDPTIFKHVKDNAWCHNNNENLVWSYKRLRGAAEEKDDNGKTVWRPIQPVRWYSQMPAWAYTNGEIRVISKEEYFKFK